MLLLNQSAPGRTILHDAQRRTNSNNISAKLNIGDGIEKTEQISPFKSSNLLLPNLRDSILAQVAFEEFLGNMSEFRVSKMIDPLLVGKTVDSFCQGALSITLTPTHENTGFLAPVKSIRECADTYIWDLNPASWFEVLETPSNQRWPVSDSAHEDSCYY